MQKYGGLPSLTSKQDSDLNISTGEIFAEKSLLLRKNPPAYIKKVKDEIEMRFSRYRQKFHPTNQSKKEYWMKQQIMLPILSPVVAGKQIFKAENLQTLDIDTHRASKIKKSIK